MKKLRDKNEQSLQLTSVTYIAVWFSTEAAHSNQEWRNCVWEGAFASSLCGTAAIIHQQDTLLGCLGRSDMMLEEG